MTGTVHTSHDIAPAVTASDRGTRGRYVRAGVVAGLGAALANVAVTAISQGAGVSLEVPDGEAIPLYALAQLTIVGALLGVAIAAIIVRRSTRPITTFTRVTVALTLASLVPDVIVDTDVATRLVLMATHVIAAAIVIPTIARRLVASA